MMFDEWLEHPYTKALLEDVLNAKNDAMRYRWIRQNPAWETEAYLSGLTPEQVDADVDKHMSEGNK